MAHILPEKPTQTLPDAVLKTFKALKDLPDTYYVWHHLAPWQPDAPDFLVITFTGQALLVKVSSAFPAQATSAAQLLLIDDDRPPLGMQETAVLSSFVKILQLTAGTPLETLTLFPNIPHKQVLESRLARAPGEPQWAGRELLQPDSQINWEDFFHEQPLDPIILEKVRQQFTPEIVVPADMTVRPPIQRRLDAGLKDYLLDYSQEAAVKADLDLPDESEALTADFRLNIINGVAGSGKTLILLYRLRLLYESLSQKRFLVLTHNQPLIKDMQSRFCRLTGKEPDNIEWETFSGWCKHHWLKGVRWIDPLSKDTRAKLVQEVWEKFFKDSLINPTMLGSEIDWYKDQRPLAREEYLTVERRGRGFRLSQAQRELMADAIQQYQKLLPDRGLLDWADVPNKIWQFLSNGEIAIEPYDVILVDEAQFFAPLWFEIIQKVLKPRTGHLFVVADPTQGFLGRGSSWKSLGLEARGRTHQLRHSHRTTREILDFASLFYRLRMPTEIDEEILTPDLLNMPSGALPVVLPLISSQDEITRVVNEAVALIDQGFPKKHLLILHANWAGANAITQAVNRKLNNRFAAMDPHKSYPGDFIRVTTLNAGAGLESPIVFLAGLHELFEEEQSLRLSDEERELVIRDNTRKIYMAVTRAGQRLVVTYKGELPSVIKQCSARIILSSGQKNKSPNSI